MANPEYLRVLQQGVEWFNPLRDIVEYKQGVNVWNQWRNENLQMKPD
jgi:hypothetical protein